MKVSVKVVLYNQWGGGGGGGGGGGFQPPTKVMGDVRVVSILFISEKWSQKYTPQYVGVVLRLLKRVTRDEG